jgi:hypothetical protein
MVVIFGQLEDWNTYLDGREKLVKMLSNRGYSFLRNSIPEKRFTGRIEVSLRY